MKNLILAIKELQVIRATRFPYRRATLPKMDENYMILLEQSKSDENIDTVLGELHQDLKESVSDLARIVYPNAGPCLDPHSDEGTLLTEAVKVLNTLA